MYIIISLDKCLKKRVEVIVSPSLFSRSNSHKREEENDTQAQTHALSAEEERAEKISQAIDSWVKKIEKSSAGNPMSDISALGDRLIDITMAHPSGIAQLYSGRPTPLSNIIREHDTLTRTRLKAKMVCADAENTTNKYGVCPTYLAIAIARWVNVDAEGKSVNYYAPLLLRQVKLSLNASDDVVFALEDTMEINPILLAQLKEKGLVIDCAQLIRTAYANGAFTPKNVTDKLTQVAKEAYEFFTVEDRLLIAPFTSAEQITIEDLKAVRQRAMSSTVVGALAGVQSDIENLNKTLRQPNPFDRKPALERGVGDLDVIQQDVLDNIADGTSLVVNTPPGSDKQGTATAILTDIALQGRTALYIPPTTRMASQVMAQMQKYGLDEFVLDATADQKWRQNVNDGIKKSLNRQEKSYDQNAVNGVRARLEQTRLQLSEYTARLHHVRQPWNVSAWDALQALTDLTASAPGPRTIVRFTQEVLAHLSQDDCKEARKLLAQACDLQIFSQRKVDNAWYGAVLTSDEAVEGLLECVQRLHSQTLPTIQRHIAMVCADTGLLPAKSFQHWEDQIELLQGVSQCLEVFQPQVFENSAANMVIATASKQWRKQQYINMKMSVRRALVKQAKELLRPNVSVEDLHTQLIRVQEKREAWKKYRSSDDSYPRIPVGLDNIVEVLNQARSDMNRVISVLGSAHHDIEVMPLNELIVLMGELAQDKENAYLLPARVRVLKQLHDIGLDELVEDLRNRNVSNDLVASELELAWWASVLGAILLEDPQLAGYDGKSLQTLAYQLRQLDKAQVNSLAIAVRTQLNNRSCVFVKDRQDEAIQLFEALDPVSGSASVASVLSTFPITRVLQPIMMAPAMLVPQILAPDYNLDVLVLDNVNSMPLAELIPVIARAKQVVVITDKFTNADCEINQLVDMLPYITLPTSKGKYNEDLLAFMAKYGYDEAIDAVPLPRKQTNACLYMVEATGIPASGVGAVESSTQEVNRVVDLVIDHALANPEKSLAVISLNPSHASRIKDSVNAAVKGNRAVEDFFDENRPEPFVVTDVSMTSGLHRDVIILSLGYTKTPNGKLLHEFGVVSKQGGQTFLVSALECAIENVIVVSSITAQDITSGYVKSAGGNMLADILTWASDGSASQELSKEEKELSQKPDRLLVDLADRLWRLGLKVEANLGGTSRQRIPLAIGHPQLPDEFLVALLTDDARYVNEPSMRRRERHWIERLQEHGWKVNTVFSTAVFMDPQGQAEEILDIVLVALKARLDEIERAKLANKVAKPVVPVVSTEPEVPVSTASIEMNLKRGPRPPIAQGLPLAAYGDDQLDDLLAWILSDGQQRSEDELVEQLRKALALTRKGAQVDAVLRHVVRRGVK